MFVYYRRYCCSSNRRKNYFDIFRLYRIYKMSIMSMSVHKMSVVNKLKKWIRLVFYFFSRNEGLAPKFVPLGH